MKTVLLFGTFDFLHSGHLHAFQEADKLGDRLVVSVARDSAIDKIKGKAPIHSEHERLALVNHIEIVDIAFLGDKELGIYSFFEELQPDIVALGYDQDGLKRDLEIFIKEHEYNSTIVTLSIYKEGEIKSSTIKTKLGL